MALELDNVFKRVGSEIYIHETSLTFAAGGFNVLLGATNAGKTTLMKLMAGLEKPTRGRIIFDGVDITKQSTQLRNISFVHQFFINYPHLSVYDNIASPLKIIGMSAADIKKRVYDTADLLQLSPMLGRKPHELSGGQQQRTALARALVKDSKIVFLDEPLANLDYKLREELRAQLPQLMADRGAIVIYATSEPTEALLLGGHTCTRFEGRVTQYGKTAKIYREPFDLITAEVFSDPPLNSARITKSGDRMHLSEAVSWLAEGKAAALADGQYTLGIRPHFVRPSRTSDKEVKLDGVVQITDISGSESVAHFLLNDDAWVSQADGVHSFTLGSTYPFYMDSSQCYYFGSDGLLAA
jgi:glycerol transport system ATP-binding protein